MKGGVWRRQATDVFLAVAAEEVTDEDDQNTSRGLTLVTLVTRVEEGAE